MLSKLSQVVQEALFLLLLLMSLAPYISFVGGLGHFLLVGKGRMDDGISALSFLLPTYPTLLEKKDKPPNPKTYTTWLEKKRTFCPMSLAGDRLGGEGQLRNISYKFAGIYMRLIVTSKN